MKPQDQKNVQTASTDQRDGDFLIWLDKTLIPDLLESGQENLADDFRRLIDIIHSKERWLEVADELGIR